MSIHYLVSHLKSLLRTCMHATVELLQKETPKCIPFQLQCPPTLPDLNPVGNNSMWEILQEKFYKTRVTHWSGAVKLSTTPPMTNGCRN